MQQRTVEQVETWESRPFSGGYSDLQDLSNESFSGAVVADDSWLFMLNGRVVGVFQGTIDDFEDGTGTVYDAPHDSLPLLFSMQERGGETRAKYFTNDTSLAEADQTLREANFTGYVELSENVLSGDYYVIYYGGKQMSAAFIGQSERLLTGDEAYERAADEVGIYEVKDVSMNITEIPAPRQPEPESEPEPESDPETEAGSAAATGGDRAESAEESTDVETVVDEAEGTSTPETTESPEETTTTDQPGDVAIDPEGTHAEADSGSDTAVSGADSDPSPTESHGDPATSSDPSSAETDAKSGTTTESSPTETEAEPDSPERTPSSGDPSPTDTEEDTGTGRSVDSGTDRPDESGTEPSPSRVESADPEPEEQRPVFKEEEEWRQTRSIPALDPDETAGEREKTERQSRKRPRRTQESAKQSSSPSSSSPPAASSSTPNSEPEKRPEESEQVRNNEQLQKLERAVKERDSKIEELTSSLDDEREAREDVQSQLDELREERNELEERISNLESALQRAKDQQAAVSPDAIELEPEEALSGTNLFVRYESKGKPTLSSLEGGEVDPEAVNSNLQLDHHTQFESENARVTGQTFDAFLEETNAYRFVSWLVRTFPYELLESGKRNALSELYGAIPDIDRVEFDGSVTVETEEGTATREFDVVIRDRMGNPLIVANLNSGRDAVRGEEMSDLIDSATVVSATEESLSGAFYVTASFFEPNALEAAEEAASTGGLFRRSEKASYVKSANKSGYHLCLVEDRAESFHVTVPEL